MKAYKNTTIAIAAETQEHEQPDHVVRAPGDNACVQDILSDEGSSRQAYIEQLKVRIKAGTYHIAGPALARKMLASLLLRSFLVDENAVEQVDHVEEH